MRTSRNISFPRMPCLFSLSISSVALFIAHLSAIKFSPSTISAYISALSLNVHKLRGQKSHLRHHLADALDHIDSSLYQHTLFKAVFYVYGSFGIGEMASNTTTLAQSVLQHQDVSFLSHAGVIVASKLTLGNFKHNQSRRPLHIHILTQPFFSLRGSRSGHYLFCLMGPQLALLFPSIFLRTVPTNTEVFFLRFMTMLEKQILAMPTEIQNENGG